MSCNNGHCRHKHTKLEAVDDILVLDKSNSRPANVVSSSSERPFYSPQGLLVNSWSRLSTPFVSSALPDGKENIGKSASSNFTCNFFLSCGHAPVTARVPQQNAAQNSTNKRLYSDGNGSSSKPPTKRYKVQLKSSLPVIKQTTTQEMTNILANSPSISLTPNVTITQCCNRTKQTSTDSGFQKLLFCRIFA